MFMAMLEIKTMTVHPSEEDSAINTMMSFGWDLKNNQEVYNKNTRMQDDFWSNDINVITETKHYIKLTFQRDPLRAHYAELVELEHKYQSVHPQNEPGALKKAMFWPLKPPGHKARLEEVKQQKEAIINQARRLL